jgi:hypothetical protein
MHVYVLNTQHVTSPVELYKIWHQDQWELMQTMYSKAARPSIWKEPPWHHNTLLSLISARYDDIVGLGDLAGITHYPWVVQQQGEWYCTDSCHPRSTESLSSLKGPVQSKTQFPVFYMQCISIMPFAQELFEKTAWTFSLFWWDRALVCLVTSPGGKWVNSPIRKRVPNLSANNS